LKQAVRRSVLAIDLVVVVDIDDVSADVEPVVDVVNATWSTLLIVYIQSTSSASFLQIVDVDPDAVLVDVGLVGVVPFST